MTDAVTALTNLVGHEPVPGDWVTVDRQMVDAFTLAVGGKAGHVQPFHVLSMLPAMLSGIDLPIPSSRMTVNYGLDRVVLVGEPQVGGRLRARVRLLAVTEIPGGLQIKRGVLVEDEEGSPVLEAETISRVIY